MTVDNPSVIVTGASGLLGSEVVKQLVASGARVVAVSRKPQPPMTGVEWITADLSSRPSLSVLQRHWKTRPALIYLAANIPQAGQKKENMREAMENTLGPLLNLLEVADGAYSHFVYASSVDVYGVPQYPEYDEQHPFHPFTTYAMAKLAGEIYVEADARIHGKTRVSLRFSQIYGPHEPVVRVIPFIREALRAGTSFRKMTSGEERRRFVYVSDAAAGVLAALRKKTSGVYHIAGPEIVTLNQLIATFAGCAGREFTITNAEVPSPAFDNIPSINAAVKDLGYCPRVSVAEGLRLVWEAVEQ